MARADKVASRRGKVLPKSFLDSARRRNIPGLELYWIAFWELRSTSGYEDPIPWSECEMWGRAHGLNYDKRERLHTLVHGMDAKFREWFRKRQELESKSRRPRGGRSK